MAFHVYSRAEYFESVTIQKLQETAICWVTSADDLSDRVSAEGSADPHTLPNLINAYSILDMLTRSVRDTPLCFMYFYKRRAAAIAIISLGDNTVEIDTFCVNPQIIASQRICGIGKRFLRKIERITSDLGRSFVIIPPDESANGFYLKRKYQESKGNYTQKVDGSSIPFKISPKEQAPPPDRVFIVPKDSYGRACEDSEEANREDLAEKIHDLKNKSTGVLVLGVKNRDDDFTNLCLLDADHPGKLTVLDVMGPKKRFDSYIKDLARRSNRSICSKYFISTTRKKRSNPSC